MSISNWSTWLVVEISINGANTPYHPAFERNTPFLGEAYHSHTSCSAPPMHSAICKCHLKWFNFDVGTPHLERISDLCLYTIDHCLARNWKMGFKLARSIHCWLVFFDKSSRSSPFIALRMKDAAALRCRFRCLVRTLATALPNLGVADLLVWEGSINSLMEDR